MDNGINQDTPHYSSAEPALTTCPRHLLLTLQQSLLQSPPPPSRLCFRWPESWKSLITLIFLWEEVKGQRMLHSIPQKHTQTSSRLPCRLSHHSTVSSRSASLNQTLTPCKKQQTWKLWPETAAICAGYEWGWNSKAGKQTLTTLESRLQAGLRFVCLGSRCHVGNIPLRPCVQRRCISTVKVHYPGGGLSEGNITKPWICRFSSVASSDPEEARQTNCAGVPNKEPEGLYDYTHTHFPCIESVYYGCK